MVLGITGKYCAGKSAVSEVLSAWGWHIIDVDRLGHHALIEKRDEVLQRFGRELDDGAGGIDRKRLGAIVFRNRTALRYLERIVHPSMVAMVDSRLAELGVSGAPGGAGGAGSDAPGGAGAAGSDQTAADSAPGAPGAPAEPGAPAGGGAPGAPAGGDPPEPDSTADHAAAGVDAAGAPAGPRVAINAALLYPMGLAERCDRVAWVHAGFFARFRRARRRDGIGLLEMLRREHAQKRIRPQFYRVDVDIVTVTNTGERATLERRLHEIIAG